jgi:hypothetical protein
VIRKALYPQDRGSHDDEIPGEGWDDVRDSRPRGGRGVLDTVYGGLIQACKVLLL